MSIQQEYQYTSKKESDIYFSFSFSLVLKRERVEQTSFAIFFSRFVAKMCDVLCDRVQENHSLNTKQKQQGCSNTRIFKTEMECEHANKITMKHTEHANNKNNNTMIAALLSRAKARREEKIATLQTRRVIQCLLARCLERREKKRILAHHHALKQACK